MLHASHAASHVPRAARLRSFIVLELSLGPACFPQISLEMRILQSLQISKRISRNSCVAQHPDRQKRDRQAASIFAYCQLPLATAVSAAPQLSVTALIVCEFRLCFAPCAGPKPPINHYSIIRRRCDRGNPQIKFPRGHIGVWSHRGDFLKYENRNIVFQNFKFPTSVDRRMFESLNVRRSYFRTSKNARVAADRLMYDRSFRTCRM